MDVLKFIVLLLVAVFAQVYVALGSPLSSEDDREMWNTDNWQEGLRPEGAMNIRLADLIKRSKAQQFHGLMGRSTDDETQLSKMGRKRNKGEMFVGLMGRRNLRGDAEDGLLANY